MRISGFPAFILTAALLLFAGHPLRADEHIQSPTGDLRTAVLTDLKPHSSGSKTYNEFWTYQFALDGNIQAVLNFSRVNLGSFKSPVCGADFTLLGFNGKNYSVAREYEKRNFVFTDSNQQLSVHEKIRFEGKLPDTHRVRFATTKRDVAYFLDLTFTDILPGKIWGDGMFKFGTSDAVGIYIHIPSAKVSGRLAIDKDTIAVSGTAYMDHTFQTDLAPALVSSGFRYVSQGQPLEVGYLLDPASKYSQMVVGYGLRESGGNFTLLKPTDMKTVSAGKAMEVKVATEVEFTFSDGSKSLLTRREDRLQQSTLNEFSGLTKMAIKSFMGGEVISFKGQGKINNSRAMAYNYFRVK
ncbi:MAG: lipocalin-like domain-containing protein [Fibrobacteria bacterium]